jgi:hypothetical protein
VQALPNNLQSGDVIRDDGGGPRIESAPELQYPRMLPHDPGPMRPWETPERLTAHIIRNHFEVKVRAIARDWPIRRTTVNGHQVCNTDDTLAHARGLLAAAIAETEKTAA